ncbi:MAG: phytanoyl-CoA dioxygenase family protein [Pseudomonadota bacterium]|nr:phytanoyl-CoA dioxygenase family protein [Pseudomonadota bacterium]
MTPEAILAQPARALTQAQREHYFTHGYVGVEGLVPAETVAELVDVTAQFVEDSRRETQSGRVFDIGPGHSPDTPVLRRIKRPDDQHSAYWRFAQGLMADVAADLAGPDVLFHHSKLNFKWFDASDMVKWHQDIQFFPHTNYNVFTIGCYLADTDMHNGPLAVLPGSHDGPLYDQYDDDGGWAGCLKPRDAEVLDADRAAFLTGPAGTLTIHNCRTLHYSPSSKSPTPRPLLLNCYSSADARAYTAHPDPSSHTYEVVRGQAARWVEHDPRPCLLPPDWSHGYTSIFAAQAGEND